ncbi:MAG TPA: M20 family metallopeptidase [Acidobacteriaceae bacterium]|nr:M20 family metallopeptidase [Acidobacteriaceae bacterium]
MTHPNKIEPAELLKSAERRQKNMLEQLEALVSIESPSEGKTSLDQASRLVARWFEALGGKILWHRQKKFGDLLEVRFGGMARRSKASADGRRKPTLLLGHLDTVWPMGTLEKMPFRVAKGKAFGPGVFDMKAGVVMALHAIAMLRERQALPTPVVVLLVSDEEIGSPVSRAVTEKIALECSAVFVLEPAQGPQGAYKTARKGVGDYRVHVRGVAAHSGVDFEKGHSAVLEMARLIEKISQFTDLKTGLTVNPGTLCGGTRTNVVAAEAQAEVDVRIARMRDAARVEKLFRGLRATDRACTLTITGGMNRPPMERSRGTVGLFQHAQGLANAMGFALEEASTGGGSDGNFTAALGIPTLDGMGAVGEGAHAPHESIVLSELAKRTALLAAMMAG